MSKQEVPLYETECLDIAAWLRAHELRLNSVRRAGPGRTIFVLEDPDRQAEELALRFGESETSRVLDERKKLISLSKSKVLSRERQSGSR